jgi:hypothetical protein
MGEGYFLLKSLTAKSGQAVQSVMREQMRIRLKDQTQQGSH